MQDKELKAAVPFAVSGSTQILEVNGRRFRGRIYPWGVHSGIYSHRATRSYHKHATKINPPEIRHTTTQWKQENLIWIANDQLSREASPFFLFVYFSRESVA